MGLLDNETDEIRLVRQSVEEEQRVDGVGVIFEEGRKEVWLERDVRTMGWGRGEETHLDDG